MKFVFTGNVEREFELLSSQIAVETTATTTTATPTNNSIKKQSIFSKRHRKSLIASMGLITLQQCSGQPSVISYSTVLFSAAGLTGGCSVATALYMISNSIFTVIMVDRVGRKTLLKRGCFLMMISLLLLAASFWHYQPISATDSQFTVLHQVTILLSMFVYIGAYQLGFGPITWLVVAEVWPISVRGEAIAFGVELNFMLNFLVQFLFPSLQETFGWSGTFLFFCAVLAFAIYFVQTHVPETTGMTLEEIESLMKGHEEIAMTEETHLMMIDEKDVAVYAAVMGSDDKNDVVCSLVA